MSQEDEALNNGSYLVTKRDTLEEKSQSTEEENEGDISEPSKSPDSKKKKKKNLRTLIARFFLLSKI